MQHDYGHLQWGTCEKNIKTEKWSSTAIISWSWLGRQMTNVPLPQCEAAQSMNEQWTIWSTMHHEQPVSTLPISLSSNCNSRSIRWFNRSASDLEPRPEWRSGLHGPRTIDSRRHVGARLFFTSRAWKIKNSSHTIQGLHKTLRRIRSAHLLLRRCALRWRRSCQNWQCEWDSKGSFREWNANCLPNAQTPSDLRVETRSIFWRLVCRMQVVRGWQRSGCVPSASIMRRICAGVRIGWRISLRVYANVWIYITFGETILIIREVE